MKRLFIMLLVCVLFVFSVAGSAETLSSTEIEKAISETAETSTSKAQEESSDETPSKDTESDSTAETGLSEETIDSVQAVSEENELPTLKVETHVQSIGWQGAVGNEGIAGTSGKALRLESMKISLETSFSGSIQYRSHIQSIGWQGWKEDGEISGTTGQKKRVEAIQIRLTGELSEKFDVYYRVHSQSFGWLGWAKNGEEAAGTEGFAFRAEAMQIVIAEKNASSLVTGNSIKKATQPRVAYASHVQTFGWQNHVYNGATSGTSGQSKRIEALKINLDTHTLSGGIRYKTHVQSYGWREWVSNNNISGTTGQAKRLEAIQIELTDEIGQYYDVYYRVHSQTYGWLGWAKNGGKAGTQGYAKRLEAIQIRIVRKGAAAPGGGTAFYDVSKDRTLLRIYMYGDSFTVRANTRLHQLFPKISTKATVGISYSNAAKQWFANGVPSDAEVVVYALGTNSPTSVNIDQAMGAARGLPVYWVNCYTLNISDTYWSSLDSKLKTAQKRYPNLHIVDWRSTAKANSGLFDRDKIHPTMTTGVNTWSQLIYNKIKG